LRAVIQPREKYEKGGYAMMPMKMNVPVGRDGWELVTCPECGRECWKTPLLKAVMVQGGVTALCTACVLRR